MTWFRTTEHCAQYNAVTKQPFEDVSCLFQDTLLGKTYMNWELDGSITSQLQPPSWQLVLAAIVASGFIQYVGMHYVMHRRAAWQLRGFVTVWNVLWLGLTTLGFLRMIPAVYHNLSSFSVRDNMCSEASSLWLSGTTQLWTLIWLWTKLVEIIVESLLVVVLKQPSCGLLQWFNNYAYVLAHGWHLYTAPVPGGFLVITVYYGIVAFMNAYCFYLNIRKLPQPQGPTMLLDIINLTQTLSGVFLSITTLHFWKASLLQQQQHPHHHYYNLCHANEPHIRWFSFGWSGGHVIIGIIYLFRRFVLKSLPEQQQQRLLQQYQQQQALLQKKSGAELEKERDQQARLLQQQQQLQVTNNNGAATATGKKKKKKKKQQQLQQQQQPSKNVTAMEALQEEESTTDTSDIPTAAAAAAEVWTQVKPGTTKPKTTPKGGEEEELPELIEEPEDSHTSSTTNTETNSNANTNTTGSKKKKKKKKNKKND